MSEIKSVHYYTKKLYNTNLQLFPLLRKHVKTNDTRNSTSKINCSLTVQMCALSRETKLQAIRVQVSISRFIFQPTCRMTMKNSTPHAIGTLYLIMTITQPPS